MPVSQRYIAPWEYNTIQKAIYQLTLSVDAWPWCHLRIDNDIMFYTYGRYCGWTNTWCFHLITITADGSFPLSVPSYQRRKGDLYRWQKSLPYHFYCNVDGLFHCIFARMMYKDSLFLFKLLRQLPASIVSWLWMQSKSHSIVLPKLYLCKDKGNLLGKEAATFLVRRKNQMRYENDPLSISQAVDFNCFMPWCKEKHGWMTSYTFILL